MVMPTGAVVRLYVRGSPSGSVGQHGVDDSRAPGRSTVGGVEVICGGRLAVAGGDEQREALRILAAAAVRHLDAHRVPGRQARADRGPDPGDQAGARVDGHAGGALNQGVGQRVALGVLGLHLVAEGEAGDGRRRGRRGDDRRGVEGDGDAELLEDDVSPGVLEAQDDVLRAHLGGRGIPGDDPGLRIHGHPVGLDGEVELEGDAVGVAHGDVVAVALADGGRRRRGARDHGRPGWGGRERLVAEIEPRGHLAGLDGGGIRAARRGGLLPAGLTHLGDGVSARDQVGEGVMAQVVGLRGRLVRVELAVVVEVQVDGPVREGRFDRDRRHLFEDRAGDARRHVFQGEEGFQARLQTVAQAVIEVDLAGEDGTGVDGEVRPRPLVAGGSSRTDPVAVEAEDIDVARQPSGSARPHPNWPG